MNQFSGPYSKNIRDQKMPRHQKGLFVKYILLGILFGIFFWVIESLIETYLFHQGDLVKQIFSPSPHESWIRLLVLIVFILFGIYTQIMILRSKWARESVVILNVELEQIFNTAADGMRIIDKEFNVLRVNETFARMTGLSREEAVGKKCYEVFRGSMCHTPDCPLVKLLGGQERLEVDVEKERGDGTKIPCILTATPFKKPGGELVGIVEDFKNITERRKTQKELEDYRLHLEELVKERTEELTIANKDLQIQITERKQAETTMRESEERFRLAAESASDLIYEWNILSDSVEWFDGIDHLLGYAPGEFPRTGESKEKILHPEDRNRVTSAIKRHLQTHDPFFQEYRIFRKDGALLHWIDRGVALRNEEDRPYKWIGVISDVTVQRKMEEALRESENHYRRLFEGAMDAVFIIDIETGLIVNANRKVEKLLNRPRKKIIGMHQSQLYPPGEDSYYLDLLKKYATGVISQPIAVTVYTSDGRKVPVEVSSSIIELKEEKKMQQAFFRDITERKKAESALRESEERFRSAFSSAAVGMGLITLDGHIMEPNKALGNIFGYSEDELVEKFFNDLVQSDYPEEAPITFQEMLSGKLREVNIERRANHKSGYNIWIQINAVLLHDSLGNPLYFITQIQDITRRKQAEEEISNVMKIKSEFTSMVSHELRTPLTVINEGINIVLDELIGGLNNQQKKMLDTAKRNVARLARLINEVLDYQKMEIGKMQWNMQENDINDVVKEVYDSMLPVVKQKKRTFLLTLGENMPKIIFDRDKILQVIINLASNAVKFAEKGNIDLITAREEDNIHIMVQDTGQGIRVEDVPKLFQSFQQVGSPGEKKAGGTGLGLAISKKIIVHHKGNIWADSEFGRGSTFHFTLPINQKESQKGK